MQTQSLKLTLNISSLEWCSFVSKRSLCLTSFPIWKKTKSRSLWPLVKQIEGNGIIALNIISSGNSEESQLPAFCWCSDKLNLGLCWKSLCVTSSRVKGIAHSTRGSSRNCNLLGQSLKSVKAKKHYSLCSKKWIITTMWQCLYLNVFH